MAVFGCLPSAHLAPYVAAQFLGASFAATIIYDDPSDDAGAVMATVPALGALETFFVEFIVTFVLRFVITALPTDPRAGVHRSIDESGEDVGASHRRTPRFGSKLLLLHLAPLLALAPMHSSDYACGYTARF